MVQDTPLFLTTDNLDNEQPAATARLQPVDMSWAVWNLDAPGVAACLDVCSGLHVYSPPRDECMEGSIHKRQPEQSKDFRRSSRCRLLSHVFLFS
jgi:hypothetical protein